MERVSIIGIIVLILGLLADIITVYVVRRFKRLRKQCHNAYIYHLAVMNIVNFIFLVILLTFEIQRKVYDIHPWYFRRWVHLCTDLIISFLFAQSCLAIFMTIDWYLFAFYPSKSVKYRKCTNTLITCCYLYVCIVSLYSFMVSFFNGIPGFLSLFLLGFLYVISLLLLAIFGVIYLCRRKDARTGPFVLKVAIVKFYIWLPFLITTLCAIFLVDGLYYLAVTFLALALLTPVVQLFTFYVWDRNYKAALSRIFDCGKNVDAEDIDHYLEESVEEGAMVYDASNGQVQHQVI